MFVLIRAAVDNHDLDAADECLPGELTEQSAEIPRGVESRNGYGADHGAGLSRNRSSAENILAGQNAAENTPSRKINVPVVEIRVHFSGCLLSRPQEGLRDAEMIHRSPKFAAVGTVDVAGESRRIPNQLLLEAWSNAKRSDSLHERKVKVNQLLAVDISAAAPPCEAPVGCVPGSAVHARRIEDGHAGRLVEESLEIFLVAKFSTFRPIVAPFETTFSPPLGAGNAAARVPEADPSGVEFAEKIRRLPMVGEIVPCQARVVISGAGHNSFWRGKKIGVCIDVGQAASRDRALQSMKDQEGRLSKNKRRFVSV